MATKIDKRKKVKTVTLFVYGTLKGGFRNAYRFRPNFYNATFIKEAVLGNCTLYVANRVPFLSEAVGKEVKGEVWEMPEQWLSDLDRFEIGYERRMVRLLDGAYAFTYFSNPETFRWAGKDTIREIGSEFTILHAIGKA